MRQMLLALSIFVALAVVACDSNSQTAAPAPPAAAGSPGAAPSAGAGQQAAKKSDQEPAKGVVAPGGHGPSIELGTVSADGMEIKAARDAGDLRPGGDVAIDVWVDGGLGKAAVVRFWIGTEDAKGSVKAKAEIEDGKWHAHVELPEPLPTGGKLWVEVEGKDGKKSVASFELK